MKIVKSIAIICFIFFMSTSAAAAQTVTLTDMANRKVTVPVDPDRIVCIGPGALRLIVYLQAAEKIVGVEEMEKSSPIGRPYWIAHPELHGLPRCGPGGPASINSKPDLEALLTLTPQVVFTTYMEDNLAEEVQKILKIPVVVLSYGTLGTFDKAIYDSMRIAATILNRKDRAEAVVSHIENQQQKLQQLTSGISEDKRPKAYVGGIGFRGTHGLESSDLRYPPLEWINAVNLAQTINGGTKIQSHLFLDKENLLNLDPEVIFIDGGGLVHIASEFNKKPQFYNSLRAVTRKRMYCLLPFNWYTTNIDTALCNAWAMGKILYPQRFKEVNLEEKANEIYTFMVGKPVYARMKNDFFALGQSPPFLNK